MNKTVFLTGGAGRIGKRVLRLLLDSGYTVKVLVHEHEPDGIVSDNMVLVRGDILDAKCLLEAVQGCQFVCHLAAIFDMIGPSNFEKENNRMFENHVKGTFNLLEAARTAGSIDLFVYASSDAVFSAIYKKYDEPVTEEVEVFPRPGRFYALAKALVESMCINYQKVFSLPYTIIRVGWCLDEDDVLESFAYEFWESLIDAKDREVIGPKLANGKGAMALLYENGESVALQLAHAQDIARGFALAIEKHEQAKNQIFNIAAEVPFRSLDVIDRVAKGLGVSWEGVKVVGPQPYVISNEKAGRMLGYRPQITVEKMIDMALAKRNTSS